MLHLMTEDILMNIVPYLDIEDRPRLRQTCVHIQNETRKKVGYLLLNKKFSTEYFSNVAFREEVLQSIANPKKQVALQLFNSYNIYEEVLMSVANSKKQVALQLFNSYLISKSSVLRTVCELRIYGVSGKLLVICYNY
jgi:hypothetical protein